MQGTYYDRKAKSGKGSKTHVAKKLYLDLLHDGRVPDAEGETYYRFDFYDYAPSVLQRNSYWFEVGRILNVGGRSAFDELIKRQIKAIRDARPLSSQEAEVVEHNLTRLYQATSAEEAISYHTGD